MSNSSGVGRERVAQECDQSMRDLLAKQWRCARAQYFACSVEVRPIVTDEWRRWRSPARPGYFVYVLQKHNGVAEQKARQREAERAALHVRIERTCPRRPYCCSCNRRSTLTPPTRLRRLFFL